MTEQFNDIVHVLQYLTSKIPVTDSVRAAMNRLAPPPASVDLDELKSRRSDLIVQRAKLTDKKKYLNEIAAQSDVHWSAKRTADQVNAEFEAVCIALAETETAIKEVA